MDPRANFSRLAWHVHSSAGAVVAACFATLLPAAALAQQPAPNVVIRWNQAALQGVRDSKLGPAMVSRALAIIHTCIYDAWAAYDNRALGTQLGAALRRPRSEQTQANRAEAVSFAAYRALVDLFPADENSVFRPLMQSLGYDPADRSSDPAMPAGIGNLACAAVLEFRHNDGSNQLGNLTAAGTPYADYTGYSPMNPPSTVPVDPAKVVDVNHWQPLQYTDASGTFVTQQFAGPQWYKVKPFALRSGDQFRARLAAAGPAAYGSLDFREQAAELVELSAALTGEQKMIAEYWADGPNSELPPGHWNLFAQYVSARDGHSLDQDVKLFFALTNAIFDAGIVAWDAKRAYDSARPATVVPFLFQGQGIPSWGGPGKGSVVMDGRDWRPYQSSQSPTPAFPEFISGHSTFSAAGAEILRSFTGSDLFGKSVTFAPGASRIEPAVTPSSPVTLHWRTFSEAADQAGFSRRLGGIHFRAADLAGRSVGRAIARQAWRKASDLWSGWPLQGNVLQPDEPLDPR
jgi:PAP2 superfamily